MKKGVFSRLLPHIIAVVIFLIVAVIFCSPALQGKVVAQHDIAQWKGAFQQSEVYHDEHGEYPLWTNSLFSGMPTFQIGGVAGNVLGGYWHTILSLGLPKPISFFFLASICFYILTVILKLRPVVGILGSLAFAYATYNPIIVSVGHDTKMFSIAYMPAVLGSFILLYEKKYWLGAALIALFTSTMIAMNHLQIVYYTFLIIGIMTIFYVVQWIKEKDWSTLIRSAGFGIFALAVGIFTNATILFTTYEYQKETIRGGYTNLSANVKQDDAETGLKKDYAFEYSMSITEPFVLMVPRMFGGASEPIEAYIEESKAIEALQTMPQELASQLGGTRTAYWGGIGGTSGPPYSGAIICFLAILSFFVLDTKYKWWALTAIILSFVMSWGQYFEEFNTFLYKYLPFYNKFRAPSMIMVIPQLLLPMLAVLSVHKIATTDNKTSLMPAIKKGLIATGIVFAILFLLYFNYDFLSVSNNEMLKQVRDMNNPQLLEVVRSYFDALADDRRSLMMKDIFRSLGFIAVAVAVVFMMLRNVFKPIVGVVILIVFAFIDLIVIDANYLNEDKYQEEEVYLAAFQKTQADQQLLADTSFYRVFNVSSAFTDNTTSYYYNSVSGYHPAKLRIYQDLIENQLMKQQPNEKVLDMLNTKYLLQKDQNGLTQAFQPRPTALGNVWFVKGINFVKNSDEEMKALNNFNPQDTAIVQENFKSDIPFSPQYDSAATIRLINNENDRITYQYQSSTNQFAVFSEIFYDKGWKAFVNGKEMPIVKANYVLRAIALPAGSGTIEFKFEPQGYSLGNTITLVSTIILLLMIMAAIYFLWKRKDKQSN